MAHKIDSKSLSIMKLHPHKKSQRLRPNSNVEVTPTRTLNQIRMTFLVLYINLFNLEENVRKITIFILFLFNFY